MSAGAKLITGPIAGHLLRQTGPGIVGVGAIMSVGLVDAYFIGRLGAGELAAIAFIFPVITALQSLGVGVMVGINSVVSRALGAGDERQALARANLGIMLGAAGGLVAGLALLAARRPIFALLQADAQTLRLIDLYMLPFALGFPLLMAMMAMNGVLRGQGAAKRNTAVLLVYAGTNWALDPLLITGALGFGGFGMAGAAYATIGGWVAACTLAVVLLGRSDLPFSPRSVRGGGLGEQSRQLLRVALPAAFTNSINPAGLAILTGFVALEGQAMVAGFGAGGRMQSFAVVPLLALSGSIGAIVGQNWGARQYGRARRALVQACAFCLVYGLVAALALHGGRLWLADVFADDPAVIAAAAGYLAISVWGYSGYGVLIVVNGALNAVDRANRALALSFARVLLVMVPLAWLGRPLLGTQAVFYGELVANLGGGLAAALIAWRVFGPAAQGEAGRA